MTTASNTTSDNIANNIVNTVPHSNDPLLNNHEKRRLKGIGHKLKPVVMVGNNGLSDTVLEEINRALDDHELVKIKTPAGSKEEREAFGVQLASQTNALLIHHIGRMALLLRRNPHANPKLSNLIRHNEEI